jgi:ATP-dependent DNA helicase MPH1
VIATRAQALGLFMIASAFVQALKQLSTHGMLMLYNTLVKFEKGAISSRPRRAITESAAWRSLMRIVNTALSTPDNDAVTNPKIAKLREIVIAHFAALPSKSATTTSTATTITDDADRADSTRVIVFTQWRDSVTEIVRVLSTCAGGIRVAPFIGQVSTSVGTYTSACAHSYRTM